MGRVEFRRPCPPLQAPRLSLHSGQEGRARELSLFRAGLAVLPPRRQCRLGWRRRWRRARHWVSGGGEGVPCRCAAHGPLGGRASAHHVHHRPGGFGGGGGGRRGARGGGGGLRRGGARLLRAAEMRPNTSGSDAGGCSAREGRGSCWRGASCRCSGSAEAPAPAGGEWGTVPVLRPPPTGRDKGGPSGPPPLGGAPSSSPRGGSAGGVGIGLAPPPLVAGVIGGPRPPHPTPGATSPRGPPD